MQSIETKGEGIIFLYLKNSFIDKEKEQEAGYRLRQEGLIKPFIALCPFCIFAKKHVEENPCSDCNVWNNKYQENE